MATATPKNTPKPPSKRANKAPPQANQRGDNAATLSATLQEAYQAFQAQDNARAYALYQAIMQNAPNDLNLWSNFGVICKRMGYYQQAHTCFAKAAAINPKDAALLGNMGSLYLNERKFARAIATLKQSLSLDNTASSVWNNLGSCYLRLGQYDLAATYYEKAVALDGKNADAAFNLSWCLLRLGEFQRGFTLYEARFHKQGDRPRLGQCHSPRWQGEVLTDKHLTVVHERGFGDSIHFARFIPVLMARYGLKAAQITFRVQDSLVTLMRASLPNITIIPSDAPEPDTSAYHISLMSLAKFCTLDPINIPAAPAYLKPSTTEAPPLIRELDEPRRNPRIGIAWQGSTTHMNDYNRSIPLPLFLALFQHIPATLYSLQKGEAADELNRIQNEPVRIPKLITRPEQKTDNAPPAALDIIDCAAFETSFDATAQIIAHLDMVITVDTAVAHLACALGKPTWILISASHDWRWFRQTNRSPWYPSATLFRQAKLGEWQPCLQRVHAFLDAFLVKWGEAQKPPKSPPHAGEQKAT